MATNGRHRNGNGRAPMGVTPRPVRVAVVGLGYWGPNLVRNLSELPTAEVACVCDARPDALEKMRTRYPAIPGWTSLDRVLADRSIDAVAFATPVATHHPLALAALRAGKHVFVEKPLAASSEEAAELIAVAEESGLVLMPGHTFLYSPPVNVIRDFMHSGQLGDTHFITMSRVNLGIHQPDVSVVWDLGPHDFSILRYWLDESPAYVSAISRGCIMPDKPDVAFINLEFASGTVAHVELAWLAPSKLRRTTIVGSRQMIVYDDASREPVRIFDAGVTMPEPKSFGEYQLSYRTGDIVSPRVDIAEPILLEMSDFCDAIRNGSTPRSSSQLGLEVVRIIEAVDRSLACSGERTPVGAPVAVAVEAQEPSSSSGPSSRNSLTVRA
jgi:predicted dehydrogenase